MKIKLLFLILILLTALPCYGDVKITDLTEDTTPTSDDLVMTVNEPGGSAANRKVTLSNLLKIPWNYGVIGSRPATCSVPQAYFATDTSVLYVCTATNTWTDYLTINANINAIAGLTFLDASIIELTGAGAAAVVTSGGNNYLLGSNSDNSALEFKTPANVLTQISGQPLDTDLTTLSSPTAWRVFYSDGSSVITELPLGADGTFLKSNGAGAAPTFAVPTGTISGVADCSGVTCLDGSETGGSYISLYDGSGNWTKLAAGSSSANLTFTLPTAYPAGTYLITSTDAGVIAYLDPSTKQATDADLTTLAGPTAWRLFYSDGSSVITELALGADGTYLKSGGAAVAPTWEVPAAGGDVTGVGDCASGDCLDGSAGPSGGGTYIRLYDGDSNYTEFHAGNSTETLYFYFPTTAGATGGMLYFSAANQLANLAAGSQYNLLAMGASIPAWTDTLNINEINLPSSNADPGTTAGQIRHDSTVTALTQGAVKWYDGASVRIVVDLDTEPVAGDDEKAVLYDDGNKKFYLGTVAAGAAGKGYPWIPAGSMISDDCAGLAQYDAAPNIIDYLAFDKDTDESALFTLSPEDWDLGTIKAKFVWTPGAEGTNTKSVIWCLSCYAVSDGETYDVALTGGPQCAAADAFTTLDFTNKIQKTTAATSALTVQGTPAQSNVVYCRVYRDADAVGDDFDQDAWLIGVKIEYAKTTPASW